jgi:hypothetical protein
MRTARKSTPHADPKTLQKMLEAQDGSLRGLLQQDDEKEAAVEISEHWGWERDGVVWRERRGKTQREMDVERTLERGISRALGLSLGVVTWGSESDGKVGGRSGVVKGREFRNKVK